MENEFVCCFSGPRPQKLPWGYNESDNRCIEMKNKIKEEISNAVKKGYSIFISGMALGFDIMCAESVLELKNIFPHIKLYCALPCKNQERLWRAIDKERYKNILSHSDSIKYINEFYTGAKCMFERNQFMVDNSSLLIALYYGLSGGTKNTIEYAEKQKLNIVLL